MRSILSKKLNLGLFLIVLEILFNFIPDIVHKYSRFSQVLFRNGLKFLPSESRGLVIFDPDLILLSTEVKFI